MPVLVIACDSCPAQLTEFVRAIPFALVSSSLLRFSRPNVPSQIGYDDATIANQG